MFDKDKKYLYECLNRIGLNEKQIKVYVHLLNSGGSTPSKISYDEHISRPAVYRILLDLSVKGLVHEIKKDNKKFFYIESTKDILNWKKDHARLADEQVRYTEGNIDFLESILVSNSGNIDVKYFNNVAGLHTIYEDHLMYSDYEMLGFSHIESIERFLGEEFLSSYIKRKAKKNIISKGILSHTYYAKSYKDQYYEPLNHSDTVEIRFGCSEKYPLNFDSEIVLYGDSKMSIVNVKNETLSGVIIQNKALYNMFRTIFYMTWDHLDPNTRNQ